MAFLGTVATVLLGGDMVSATSPFRHRTLLLVLELGFGWKTEKLTHKLRWIRTTPSVRAFRRACHHIVNDVLSTRRACGDGFGLYDCYSLTTTFSWR